MQHRPSIGLRELRQRASELLRRVEAGDSIEITTRGRPVAILVPLRGASRGHRLVREGRVLRGLDAIHLAAAQLFGDELRAVVTYDSRMASAASSLDLRVDAPR
jgi:prevent-host-death family protein